MKRWKNIRYTLMHNIMLNRLAMHYHMWHISFLFHDLDKVLLYLLGLDKKRVQKLHRAYSRHHCKMVNGEYQNPENPLEAVLD